MSHEAIAKEVLDKVADGYDGPDRASTKIAYYLGAGRAVEMMAEAGVLVSPEDMAKALDAERDAVIGEMRLLADLRSAYGGSVEEEVLTVEYVADVMTGEETGEGWIPTHLQDRWRGTAGLS